VTPGVGRRLDASAKWVCGSHLASCSVGTGGSGVKQPVHEADNSPTYSAKVKN